MVDIIGPGANTTGATSTRPTDSRTVSTPDLWFKDCTSPSANDGTVLVAGFLNQVKAQIATAIRSAAVTEDNSDDAMLWKAIQAAAASGSVRIVYGLTAGAANAYTLAPSPVFASLSALTGVPCFIRFNAANTGASTLAVNSLTALSITRLDGTALQAGDLATSRIYLGLYDGTAFRVLNILLDQSVNIPRLSLGALTPVASATTVDLGAQASLNITITGTTTIGSLGNTATSHGLPYVLRFAGALTLTNSATLILPGAANIVTAAGDVAVLVWEGSSVWRCISYTRAAAQAAGFSNIQIFTTSGTFNVPAGITKGKATVVGGGGYGASGGAGNPGGAGGNAGGAAIKIITGLSPGGPVTVTIGAAGTSGSPTGGTSSFGAYCSASGGSIGGGSGGGIGSGGDLNIRGGAGSPGIDNGSGSGAGGAGGNSILGGGGTPTVAGNYGGGGSGGGGSGGAQGTPGAGVVMVEW